MPGSEHDKLLPIGSFGHAIALTKLVEILLAEVANMLGDEDASASDRLLALHTKATGLVRGLRMGGLPDEEIAQAREDAEQTLRAMFGSIRIGRSDGGG